MPARPKKDILKKKVAIAPKKKLLRKKSGMCSQHKISIETVKHVAEVARLDLTEAELKKFQKDLNDILSAFRELDEANPGKNIEPSFQPLPVKDITREDVVEKSLSQNNALENTKHKQDGYFKGPRAV
jgi:aspartyl-tRNA(Asn)/glutamyl-tRNA(Gln) amidotransferase subunit C